MKLTIFKNNHGYGWAWTKNGQRVAGGSAYKNFFHTCARAIVQRTDRWIDKLYSRIVKVKKCSVCGRDILPKWHPFYVGNFHTIEVKENLTGFFDCR